MRKNTHHSEYKHIGMNQFRTIHIEVYLHMFLDKKQKEYRGNTGRVE